uniref:(northern house mosquito) hypothetical protein n=1 Tax=Culex pipiens TaxID=7175 RepID=A0A8D8L9E4_CULPI
MYSDEDVHPVGVSDPRNDGTVQLQPRVPQLPDPGHLQVLQAGPRAHRQHPHPGQEARSAGFLRCDCDVRRFDAVYAGRFAGFAGVQPIRGAAHFVGAAVRCSHWERAGEGDARAQSAEQRGGHLFVRDWICVFECDYAAHGESV